VRFLVDANLSPRVAQRLREAGHDAIHVVDVGFLTASDEVILAHATRDSAVIVSADTDFAMLLATRALTQPSFVLLRSADRLTPDEQASLILANVSELEPHLVAGAVVTIARGRLRLRTLPLQDPDKPSEHQS
jgi:predicted nuclease of predicted toxin-antitoxin system